MNIPACPEKKKLGIISGMGSHAGVWLFDRITRLSYAKKDQEYLDILIHNNSAVPDRTRAIVHRESCPLPELRRSIALFNQHQVEVAVMACMTAHYYWEDLARTFQGTLLSAVGLVADELVNNPRFRGHAKIGIIGTTGLQQSGIYRRALAPLGREVVALDEAELEEYFMKPIYGEGGVKSGIVTDQTRRAFARIIDLLRQKGAGVIVGGCSEVPLVLTGEMPFPYLDAFELLARRAVDHCYNKRYTYGLSA